jgi:hypothetical protein
MYYSYIQNLRIGVRPYFIVTDSAFWSAYFCSTFATPRAGFRPPFYRRLHSRVCAERIPGDQPSNWDPTVITRVTGVAGRDAYLKECDDVYTRFILQKLSEAADNAPKILEVDENAPNLSEIDGKIKYFEKHHIIPKSVGGPDLEWNIVVLTFEDHFIAHKLRYEAYGQYNPDKLFLILRTNQTAEKHQLLLRAGHATQRIKKLGFFDPVAQSARGKLGGAKQTQKKVAKYREKMVPAVAEAFAMHMLWIHTDKNREISTLIFFPDTLYIVKDLYYKLDACVPFSNRNQSSNTSGLARVIKRQRKKYCGWSLHLF